ncbi:hypothetical protein FNF31_02424 [Cafeteria roenbergensis]|uniref:ABC transporter domain-containing protein n=1 Tax=Cafeteria roenbergensis TaxID=33653 RepID=A0A5A8D0H9_CAFRO|nr:hypothetical protein FNF28_06223 [Cafeteria roenbergensis]KAA0164188.1 hypothetical protein FNF31_02424 [Cafeteria roenbergensis]
MARPGAEKRPTFAAKGSTLCGQTSVLVWLNAVRALRAWKQTVAILVAPPVVTIILVLLQLLANVVVDKEVPFPVAMPVGNIPRCQSPAGPCVTILYAPDTPRVQTLLGRVAADNGLEMGVDIVPIGGTQHPHPLLNTSFFANSTLGNAGQCRTDPSALCPPPEWGHTSEWERDCLPCDYVADSALMDAHLLEKPNQTQIAITFVGEYAADVLARPAQSYSILRNYSIHQFPFFAEDHSVQTKLALDSAALEIASGDASPSPRRASGPAGLSAEGRNKTSFSLDVWWRHFPTPLPRVHGYQVAAMNGGIYFFVPACVIFFTLVSELVGEKESKRRVGMRTMGLKNAAFWLAWSVHAGVLSLVSALLLTACGWAAGFEFFTNSHWLVPPALFTFFNWAFSALAFLVSALVRSQRTAQSIAYTLCLIGFVFQVILCSAYGKLIDLLYGNVADWVVAVRWLLSLYPAFHLSKAFYAVAELSSSEIDVAAGHVTKGPGFHWSDLWETKEIKFFGMDIHDPAPAQAFGFLLANMLIFGVLALYLDAVLAGDQGTPAHPCFCIGISRSRGSPGKPRASDAARASGRKPLSAAKVPLLGSEAPDDGSVNFGARGGGSSSSSRDGPREIASAIGGAAAAGHAEGIDGRDATTSDPGVREERAAAVSGRGDFRVRLSGLRKVYRAPSACCGLAGALQDSGCLPGTCNRGGATARVLAAIWGVLCCTACGACCRRRPAVSSKAGAGAGSGSGDTASTSTGAGDVLAVDGLSLTVKPGTCLGLLGHNGAGKSTLLKILSGLELPTEGVAEVNGFDVATDVASVQATLGTCPQHDLQWPELTAREHLQLFARLKGLQGGREALAHEVEERLEKVNLVDDADRAAGTFSGGMRRRLSVAVACIGNPSVILLDEAATGLDPVNRSELWRMILDLKRDGDKALIVTTHDLQEAELLSDRVAIMGHGRVWCVGSSLDLKGRYGGGYRVAVNAAQGREDAVALRMRELVPSSHIMSRDASSLTFTVPLDRGEQMSRGLEWLEAEAGRFGAALQAASLAKAVEMRRALPGAGPAPADEAATLQSVVEGLPVGAAALIEAEAEAFGARVAGEEAVVREWNVSLDNLESVFLQVNRRADAVMGRSAAGAETEDVEDEHEHDGGVEAGAGVLAGGAGALRGGRAIGKRSAAPAAVEEDEPEDEDEELDSMGRRVVRSFGCRALCIKNFTLISRQRGLCICQIMTPLSVMALLVLLQAIIKAEVGTDIVNKAPSVVQPFAIELDTAHARATIGHRETAMLSALFARASGATNGDADWQAGGGAGAGAAWGALPPSVAQANAAAMAAAQLAATPSALGRQQSAALAAADTTLHPMLAQHPLASNGSVNGGTTDCLEFFVWSAEPGAPVQPAGGGRSIIVTGTEQQQSREELVRILGSLDRLGNGTGLLGNISQHSCQLKNKTHVKVPYFDPRADGAQAISLEIVTDLNSLNSVNDDDLDRQPPCHAPERCPAYLTPDGSLVFHTVTFPGDDPSAPGHGTLSFTLAVNDAQTMRFRRPNNFTRVGFVQKVPSYVSDHADVSQAGRMALIEMMVEAYSQQAGLKRGQETHSGLKLEASVKLLGSMPTDIIQNLMTIVEVFGAVLWPIALTLQLPLFAFVSVLEKETGLLELQKAMGLRMWQWHAVSYGINLSLYGCVVAFFWSCGRGLGFHVFTQVPVLLNLLFYVGWGLSLVSMSVLVASCINDRRVATVGGYVVALMGTLIGTVLADGIYGDLPPFSLGGIMPRGLYAFPPFALTRVVYLLNFNCLAKAQCPTLDQAFGGGATGEIGAAIVAMYLMAAAYLVVGLYLNEVVGSPHSVPAHWAFCVPAACRPPSCTRMGKALASCLCSSCCGPSGRKSRSSDGVSRTRSQESSRQTRALRSAIAAAADGGRFEVPAGRSSKPARASVDGSAGPDPSACLANSGPLRRGETGASLLPLFPFAASADDAWSSACKEDTDVTDERRRVRALLGREEGGAEPADSELDAAAAGSGHGVIMSHLRKVYPGSSVAAVQDVSIAIREGETLAFLGENGCGKSTTVAMVTGGLAPTAGDAWIGGFNVQRDTGEVHLRTGITHQHERLWEDLTCEEHLLFYARLKGVAPHRLAKEVAEALRAVGLFGVRGRNAGALSGGMRRRLAVAISFSGRSTLCAEDELTTGSDIATRRRLWRVIQNAKSGRSGASAAMTATSGTAAAAAAGASKRVLLIVTHLFDEVEALADRVCIVVKGRIRVVGTPAHLKERFGATYRVNVSWPTDDEHVTGDAARAAAIGAVTDKFPDARLDVEYDGSATIMVPRTAGRSLSGLFTAMRAVSEAAGLTNWSVGQVTLEDVFASVVHAHRADHA